MIGREYYRLLYRLDGVEQLLLWFTDENDGVVTDADGLVPAFVTEKDLIAFADRLGVETSDEVPILHDLDVVRIWLADPRPDRIDCEVVLAAWNHFGDVARSAAGSASFSEAAGELGAVYDKLFWGNNLPAVTPEGEAFHPVWSSEEIRDLAEVLARGLDLFARVVRSAA